MQTQSSPPPLPSDNPQPRLSGRRRGRRCNVPGEYLCCRIVLLVTEARKDALQTAADNAQISTSRSIMGLVDAGEAK